jgi:predicted acylesterase/phospholipase RssA
MNFSFAGCGFLGIYHVGVASCLKQHAPQLIEEATFLGASAGALVSTCLMCGLDIGNKFIGFVDYSNVLVLTMVTLFRNQAKITDLYLGQCLT